MSGYESYSKAATRQMNWENRKQQRAEPRRQKHKDQEFPDVDTFQRYKRLQEEDSE